MWVWPLTLGCRCFFRGVHEQKILSHLGKEWKDPTKVLWHTHTYEMNGLLWIFIGRHKKGKKRKKPESQFILEARATMETHNEVFKHMFWAEPGRAACVGYNHKQSCLKRALILKGLHRNNQFMCTITKCIRKEIKSHKVCVFSCFILGPTANRHFNLLFLDNGVFSSFISILAT